MSAPEPSCHPALFLDITVHEILLRFPPDEPECLARASLVCKGWHRVLDDPGFRRRYGEFHRRAPILGLFYNIYYDNGCDSRFASTTTFSPQSPLHYDCYLFDSRHGLVLFAFYEYENVSLFVWDPITGVQWRVTSPRTPGTDRLFHCWNAAVLCAADGCDHVDCHGNPFLVAFVGCNHYDYHLKYACVYSSEAGTWSCFTSSELPHAMDSKRRSVVLGNTIYFPCHGAGIMGYDLDEQKLSWIDVPLEYLNCETNYFLVATEDSNLGFVREVAEGDCMYMWTRVSDANGAWAQPRVIELDKLVHDHALSHRVICFVEGDGAIYLATHSELLMVVDVKSRRVRKLQVSIKECIDLVVIPYKSFYTPRTSLERAQGLLQKGSNAMEARDFIDAVRCLGRAHEIRAAFYGELSPKCAMTCYKYGFALLRKAQEGIGLNILKGVRNEESVRSATSQDDTGKSEASVKNITDAPSSEKGHTEQWQNSNGKYQKDGNHDSDKDDGMSGDKSHKYYSDLDLSWKMLNNARAIVEKNPDHTMEKVKIFSALAAVSMEREDIDNTLDACLKALAILDHLVEPDHHQIVKLNSRICSISELAFKIGDTIPYFPKAVPLCSSRKINLKKAKGDKGDDASSAEGGLQKSALEDMMDFLTSILIEFEKKLEDLEQEMSAPSPTTSEVVIASEASGEQNVANSMSRAVSSTCSQIARSSNTLDSPTVSIPATTGCTGCLKQDVTVEPRPVRILEFSECVSGTKVNK